jgi:hypothetical protein
VDDGLNDPERPSRSTKSNKMKTQKRAVLNMAFGYAGAWFLVWTPYFAIIFAVVFFSKNSVRHYDSNFGIPDSSARFIQLYRVHGTKSANHENDSNAPGINKKQDRE